MASRIYVQMEEKIMFKFCLRLFQLTISLVCIVLLFCGFYLSVWYGISTFVESVQGGPVEAVVVSDNADAILKIAEKDSDFVTIVYSYDTDSDDVKEEITIKENTYLINVGGRAAILSDNTAHTIGKTVYVSSLTTTCPVYRYTIDPEAESSSVKFFKSILFLCTCLLGCFVLNRIDLFSEEKPNFHGG